VWQSAIPWPYPKVRFLPARSSTREVTKVGFLALGDRLTGAEATIVASRNSGFQELRPVSVDKKTPTFRQEHRSSSDNILDFQCIDERYSV
jgi:hypothetical protein